MFFLSIVSDCFPFLFTDIFKEGIWKETETFEDPYLQSLTSRLQTSVLSARAPATTNMYHRAFRKWMDFALGKLNISFLPAKPVHVAIYLQHALESTNSSSSVDTAFYAIKWAYEIVGVASPTNNQVVSRVREAAKRIPGAGRPNRKEPLSVEVLKEIVEGADLSNALELRNVCLYVLSYAGFFRSEEVLSIRMSNIRFYEGFMIIKVDKSKTDQLRQGGEVVIAQSEGNVCPVFLLKEYLKKLDNSPDSSEFIFRPLVKTKSSYKLVNVDKHISYATFRGQLTKSLQSIVPDPSVYGTHSFRSGGASRAANSRVSDRVFQRHGRWKSVAAKDSYVKDDMSSRLAVSKSLGL